MLDELTIRVITAVVYGLLLALILPILQKDLKRSKEQFLKFHQRLRERGLTIFDAWRKRYYLPEGIVNFKEQVMRTTRASLFLTASLGLLAVGLGFAFDLPPDRAIWVPPIGGLLMFIFGVVFVPLIQRASIRFGKPLEPIEREVPSAVRFKTIPMKPWLLLGFVVATVMFISAALTSYFLHKEVYWSVYVATALGGFIGFILVMWLMMRKE
jgi:uncharacterized membrane protein YvlD (DUF360 family)